MQHIKKVSTVTGFICCTSLSFINSNVILRKNKVSPLCVQFVNSNDAGTTIGQTTRLPDYSFTTKMMMPNKGAERGGEFFSKNLKFHPQAVTHSLSPSLRKKVIQNLS